jgi:TolA-binding protein
MTNEQLEQRINDMQFQIDDLKTVRDPLRANQRIDLLQQQLSVFGVKIEELGQKLNAFCKEDKFIERFTDDEFKLLYKNSGLGAKDIANLMKANENFKELDSTPQSINQIINGKRGSLELRSYLGKQFRFAITKRQII